MAGDGTWTVVSALPECDIHKYEKGEPGVEARYDGKTIRGPWANMCEPCFGTHGIGLGIGRGQRLILRGERTPGDSPLERLRYHVTGAVERGEAVPIVEQPAPEAASATGLDEFFDGLSDEDAKLIDEGPAGVDASHSRESDEGWFCFICGQAKDDGPHRDGAHEPRWVKED